MELVKYTLIGFGIFAVLFAFCTVLYTGLPLRMYLNAVLARKVVLYHFRKTPSFS